jgi:hypothetical protein
VQENPFSTDAFMWLDAMHYCNSLGDEPTSELNLLAAGQMSLFLQHMNKIMIVSSSYKPVKEVHGFEALAFRAYAGIDDVASIDLVTCKDTA